LRDEAGKVNGVCGIATDITDRKKIQDEVERLSQVDVLTNLANRRHFMVLAEQEMSRTRRYGGPLSALMLDVDFFKKINDTYGHKAGDAVLSMLGERCRNTLRTIDIAGRIGGEEFAFLLPQTLPEKAAEVAERLRRSIADLPVELDDGRLLSVTVSIGVAGLDETVTTVDTLISLADKALYAAKDGGRNRVSLAD
jgi:diguanylate cyclase (GGDEF)-like protein